MELIIKKEFFIDDLPEAKNIPLCTTRGKDGELGFQQNQSALLEIVNGAYCLCEDGVSIVSEKNIGKIMSKITKKKYGILAHGGPSLSRVAENLELYINKLKIYELKKRKGIARESLTHSAIYEDLFGDRTFQQAADRMLEFSDYLSIWPIYWGEFGEHFFLYAKNTETALRTINNKIKQFII